MKELNEDKSNSNRQPLSLLWPENKRPQDFSTSFDLPENVKRDLELDKLFHRFADSDRQYLEIAPLLQRLCFDQEVLAYRQAVMEDFLNNPALCRCFEELMPVLEVLWHNRLIDNELPNELYRIMARLGALESYILCVTKLSQCFSRLDQPLKSVGLKKLEELVAGSGQDEDFHRLARELPVLLSNLRGIRSVTIGVNLDVNLLPHAAALVAVSKELFTENSGTLLSRLLGKKGSDWECIAPLHAMPGRALNLGRYRAQELDKELFYVNPLLVPLFRDLNNVLKKVSTPVYRALKHYAAVQTAPLGLLKPEVVFYLGARRLVNELKAAGLPFTRPEFRPKEERTCFIKNSFNVNLAIALLADGTKNVGETIVKNDIRFDAEGRVLILTGPNRGGKTVYAQSIGLCHVLAQLGLPVPGEEAVLSPVDGVYTHFPVEEKIDFGTGRLGDEAKRIDEIFTSLTPHSLVLLNEALSSTSADESLYISRDIVRILVRLGVRCLFTTHLHELAARLDEINREVGISGQAVSLVAQMEESTKADGSKALKRTYRILPGPPAGLSYAREIAERYGVSYGQLSKKLQDRGWL